MSLFWAAISTGHRNTLAEPLGRRLILEGHSRRSGGNRDQAPTLKGLTKPLIGYIELSASQLDWQSDCERPALSSYFLVQKSKAITKAIHFLNNKTWV